MVAKNKGKTHLIVILVIFLIGFVGCSEKGSAEKAGERMDEIIDNVKEGELPLKEKGTLEKMGESIDESVTR